MKNLLVLFLMTVSSLVASGYNYIDINKIGKGDHVLIITGAGGGIFWEKSIGQIAKSHTCHIISIKAISGHTSAFPFEKDEIEKEVTDYMKANHIEKANIIGHSLGGYIAIKTVLNYPALFSKIIIVDSYPCATTISAPEATSQIIKAQSEYFNQYVKAMSQENFNKFWGVMAKGFFADTVNMDKFLKVITNSDRNFLTEFQTAVISEDLRPELSKINAQVLVLSALNSFKGLPISPEQLKQRIDSQFSLLKNYKLLFNVESGHFIMMDQKDWFVEKVSAFLSK